MTGSILGKIRREWAQREYFKDSRSWLIWLYNRLLRRTKFPLPMRGKIVPVSMPTLSKPIFVRLGSTDLLVVFEIFRSAIYDPLVQNVSPPVRNVLDLGANIGASVRLWRQLWPDASIIALEPDESNAKVFERNMQIESNADRTKLMRICAAGRSRTVNLASTQGEWSIHMDDSAGPGSVQALTLPEILRDAGCTGEIDVLKCDIEGAEMEVFEDCSAWIKQIKNIVVEIHDHHTVNELMQCIRRGGGEFEVVHHQDSGAGLSLAFFKRTSQAA